MTHYLVEKDDVTGRGGGSEENWELVSRFVRTPELQVGGLFTGRQYRFRVCAVNEVGRGDSIETEHVVFCKKPPGILSDHLLYCRSRTLMLCNDLAMNFTNI